MITKILDFDTMYNFCFNEKIVTPKNLPLQAFVIATLENSFGSSALITYSYPICVLLLSEIGQMRYLQSKATFFFIYAYSPNSAHIFYKGLDLTSPTVSYKTVYMISNCP